jgi:hypothetical protein
MQPPGCGTKVPGRQVVCPGRSRRTGNSVSTLLRRGGEDTSISIRIQAVGNPDLCLAAVSIKLAGSRAKVPYVTGTSR